MARLRLVAIEGTQDEEQSRIVQPELNLEQWALFVPSQARHEKHQVRVLEHVGKLLNNDTITYTVKIDFCSLGTLTAKDQRVLYALFQNWKEKGTPLSYCYYSAYRLAQILKMKWGGENQESILNSLRRLHAVT
ncbi:MAG: hypothetical protein ACRENF_04315, partial [Thermodesulfobacteriota bacterium]